MSTICPFVCLHVRHYCLPPLSLRCTIRASIWARLPQNGLKLKSKCFSTIEISKNTISKVHIFWLILSKCLWKDYQDGVCGPWQSVAIIDKMVRERLNQNSDWWWWCSGIVSQGRGSAVGHGQLNNNSQSLPSRPPQVLISCVIDFPPFLCAKHNSIRSSYVNWT